MTDDERQAQLDRIEARLAHLERSIQDVRSLVGPFGVPLPDGSMLVQTIHGQKYCIDPMDEIIAPNLIVYRQWEADLSRILSAAAHKDTVFIDVGANFGYFTCLIGSAIGPHGTGRIIAVEPNQKLIPLLRKNIAINWSMCPIEIHDCALADREAMLNFFVPADRASNASLSPLSAETADAPALLVHAKRLDSIVNANTPVDLMKIDVEGHEVTVLRGAEGVIARSPDLRIVIEWSPAQMEAAGYAAIDAFGAVSTLGLRMFRLPESEKIRGDLGRAIEENEVSTLGYCNLLLAR
jgi:FkbM family methyltransferase